MGYVINMKNFILLLAFILISTVHAGTCTSISRTNSASLSVLTSTKYNTDLNTVYTAANALDGGCITDGTLEDGALNTTDFAALLKGLQQGCKLLYSNASTVQIDKCIASVNGNFINTTSATNASFGCTGCSAEVASTTYYVYIQTGSSGSTITPLILTTAPNNDGYDNSGNKVIGRFFNNGSSNIETNSIHQYHVNGFVPDEAARTPGLAKPVVYSAQVSGSGTVSNERGDFISGNCTNATPIVCTFNTEIFSTAPNCSVTTTNSQAAVCVVGSTAAPTVSSISIGGLTAAGSSSCTPTMNYSIVCHGVSP